MNSARSILSTSALPTQRFGEKLTTRDVHVSASSPDLDPFVAVSLYDMRGPTFPPHPHAGFMVATYILPESDQGFVNQDSLGTHNRIAPGALHVTVAGRGVLHEEQPEVDGRLARGFQLWIDLPNDEREQEPCALHLDADSVPRAVFAGGEARVVLGELEGQRSPVTLPTRASVVDVSLAPVGSWKLHLPRTDNAFLFVIDGALEINGHYAGAGSLVRTRADGEVLDFVSASSGARFTLFAGKPLSQHRVQHGPFVARDQEQLMRFMRNHANGEFGALTPLPRV